MYFISPTVGHKLRVTTLFSCGHPGYLHLDTFLAQPASVKCRPCTQGLVARQTQRTESLIRAFARDPDNDPRMCSVRYDTRRGVQCAKLYMCNRGLTMLLAESEGGKPLTDEEIVVLLKEYLVAIDGFVEELFG